MTEPAVSPTSTAELCLAEAPRAVFFDVDYTLLRPNEMFYAPGYRRMGERFGLVLDEARWPAAERAAYAAVKARRERLGLMHDDGVYEVIAQSVIVALGGADGVGGGDSADGARVQSCAAAVIAEWTRCENFTLYDDVRPCLTLLRDRGITIGLVSNTNRDLAEVLDFFRLGELIEFAVTSQDVGEMKPSPRIYAAALEAAGGVPAGAAVMVGDSVEDDVRGAAACGFAALLLDRYNHPDRGVPTIRSLQELPAALRLA